MSKPAMLKTAAVVVVILACLVAWALLHASAEPLLSREQVSEQVQLLYEGKVVSARLQQSIYKIELRSQLGLYELDVDGRDGGIQAIRRIEAYDPVEAGSNDQHGAEPSAPEQPPVSEEQPGLSGSEAAKLALQQVQGTVDEVEYKQQGSTRYYLVEIDTDAGEAVVQVHAITGAIMSITWDDAEEDDAE